MIAEQIRPEQTLEAHDPICRGSGVKTVHGIIGTHAILQPCETWVLEH